MIHKECQLWCIILWSWEYQLGPYPAGKCFKYWIWGIVYLLQYVYTVWLMMASGRFHPLSRNQYNHYDQRWLVVIKHDELLYLLPVSVEIASSGMTAGCDKDWTMGRVTCFCPPKICRQCDGWMNTTCTWPTITWVNSRWAFVTGIIGPIIHQSHFHQGILTNHLPIDQ